MSLRALRDRGRWCQVQVEYAVGGGATSAKVERLPWDRWGELADVIDRLAAEIVEVMEAK